MRFPDPVSVLIVDDSVVVRRLVAAAIAESPGVLVAGTASSGRMALERIPQLAPDLLTLDIEMPDLDGLETLRRLRRLHPQLPVIMFSTATERAAAATLEALSLGARDYVTKPSTSGGVQRALEVVRLELIPKILALSSRRQEAPFAPAAVLPGHRAARRTGPFELLAIGASTGGPNALASLLGELPGDLPVPVIITQHMPPLFTRLFAERLDRSSTLRVVEGTGGMLLEPGLVVVAPGDYHLVVRNDAGRLRVETNQEAPQSWCRPSVDVMFASVAATVGDRALACVLTGMGSDGLRGCSRLRAAGAEIVVQDEATSIVWGMPGAVTSAGLADRVVPLPALAADLTSSLRRSRWGPAS